MLLFVFNKCISISYVHNRKYLLHPSKKKNSKFLETLKKFGFSKTPPNTGLCGSAYALPLQYYHTASDCCIIFFALKVARRKTPLPYHIGVRCA